MTSQPPDLTPERWERISALFADLAELPAEARRRALNDAAASDAPLHDEVESLLSALQSGADRFDSPPGISGLAGLDDPAVDRSGERMGGYTLVRKVGSGGMGDVYEAIRTTDDFTKRVALKMIHPSRSSEQLGRRFRRERRILAQLNHRNIAALVDGGVAADGHPFLAMEFVAGETLTAWCASRQLGVRDRVSLFRQVCNAVDHAHRNLVVHRDLKPGNILVTEDGTVKLLDFGVAKLLSPDDTASDDLTTAAVAAFTPAYASPEQLRGEPITTASDIFSLGVVLYELLTGHHPYREPGVSEGTARDRVLAGPPPTPSAVAAARRGLAGDLDAIVLTALRTEPARRYRSAESLGDDLRRWLAGLPVSAQPDSLGYRLRRFARRNLVATVASGAGMLALATGTVATAYQARVARLERDRARTAADKASQVTAFMEGMLRSADPRGGGRQVTVAEALDSASARASADLATRPELQAAVLTSIGVTYLGLGRLDEARALLTTVLDTRRRIGATSEIPAALYNLARVYSERGEAATADTLFRQALAGYLATRPVDSLEVARVLNDLGDVLQYEGKLDEALGVQRQALTLRRASRATPPEDVAASLNNVAVILGQQGHMDQAEPLQRAALATILEAKGPLHPDVASALNALAFVLGETGKFAEADSMYRQAIRIRTNLLGATHPEVTSSLSQYGWLLHDAGRFDSAAVLARAVLSHRGPDFPDSHPMVGSALTLLGQSLLAIGDVRACEAPLRQGLTIRKANLPPDHWLVASTTSVLGECLWSQGLLREAEPLLVSGLEGLRTGRGVDHPATRKAADRLSRFRAEQAARGR